MTARSRCPAGLRHRPTRRGIAPADARWLRSSEGDALRTRAKRARSARQAIAVGGKGSYSRGGETIELELSEIGPWSLQGLSPSANACVEVLVDTRLACGNYRHDDCSMPLTASGAAAGLPFLSVGDGPPLVLFPGLARCPIEPGRPPSAVRRARTARSLPRLRGGCTCSAGRAGWNAA